MATTQDLTFEIHEYWSQQFHAAKEQPRRIAGNAPNLWAITTSKTTYRLVSGVWEPVRGVEGVISISVGLDGTVVVVRENGEIWMFDGDLWKELKGGPLVQVSVGSRANMVGRNKDNDVYYWDGAEFRPLMVVVADRRPMLVKQDIAKPQIMQVITAFNARLFKMTDVSIAHDGTIVGVTAAHEVFRWDGINWQIMKGKLLSYVHVASRTQIVGIDQNLQAWRYVGRDLWKPLGINYCKQLLITTSGLYWGLVFNTNPAPQEVIVESLLPVYIFRGHPTDPSVDHFSGVERSPSLQGGVLSAFASPTGSLPSSPGAGEG